MGAWAFLPLPSAGEERAFLPGLGISSWGKQLKAQHWRPEEWDQAIKPYFCLKASRPWLLQTSLLSHGQIRIWSLPLTGLNESAPLLPLLLTSCCQLQSPHCLLRSTAAEGEGIRKLWLTFAIKTTNTVINQSYGACAAPFLTALKNYRRQLCGSGGQNSHCFQR